MKKSKKIENQNEIIGIIFVLVIYYLISGTVYDFPGKLSKQFFGSEIWGWLIFGIFLVGSFKENALKDAALKQQLDKTVENPVDELKKWSDLRDSGVITDKEFQKKKKELMG